MQVHLAKTRHRSTTLLDTANSGDLPRLNLQKDAILREDLQIWQQAGGWVANMLVIDKSLYGIVVCFEGMQDQIEFDEGGCVFKAGNNDGSIEDWALYMKAHQEAS